jgi:two-component system, NarL family, invasion response regulator UvrY
VQVLIIDDHPIVLAGCRLLVGSDSDIELLGAFCAESALTLYAETRPSVVVLDLQMPGTSMTQLLRRLLDLDARARIMIFSTNDDPLLAAQLIEAGARGYVSKAEDPTYVVAGIREIAAGRFYMSPALAQKVATLRLSPQARLSPKITPRERDILSMLAQGKSMTEIAGSVNLSYKSVSAICNRLRARFDARTTIELVRIAMHLGVC